MRYAGELAQTRLASEPGLLGRSARAGAQADVAAQALARPRPEMLVAAAWLHAIGSGGADVRTGFAPVDGGLELLSLGWPQPVISLVAHQAQSRMIAKYMVASHELSLIPRIQGWPADILDFAILTSGPDGHAQSVADGLAGVEASQAADGRIPPDVAQKRLARLERAGRRVERALGTT